MNRFEILDVLTMLAESTGTYKRLLECWVEYDMLDEALSLLEAEQFANPVELVLYIEGVN